MKVSRKPLGMRIAAICGMAFLILTVAGVYLVPRGDANGGWIYVKEDPVLRVAPTPIPNKKGVKVTIAGVGFEPKQELGLRIMMGGVMSDVRHQVKPAPMTNEEGAFYSEWTLGNELRLLGPGAHTIAVVNEEGDVLAHAPFVVAEAEKKAKAKKK
jgi:hypothetical protein